MNPLLIAVLLIWGQQGNISTIQQNHEGWQSSVTGGSPRRLDSDTGRVELLTTAEYERVQSLRQMLRATEDSIAKAHGVITHTWETKDYGTCQPVPDYPCFGTWHQPDFIEFRGQFLLINLPPSPER